MKIENSLLAIFNKIPWTIVDCACKNYLKIETDCLLE